MRLTSIAMAFAALAAFAVPAKADFTGNGIDYGRTSAVEGKRADTQKARQENRKLTRAERQKLEREKAAKAQSGKKETRKLTATERRELQRQAERQRMREASKERQRAMAEDARRERPASERQLPGLLSAFFGRAAEPVVRVAPETRAQDAALQARQSGRKQFQLPAEFEPQTVAYSGGHKRGTIVIDTKSKFLYLVEGFGQARRYKVAVGREGLLFTGKATVGDMQEWPRWIPTKEMQQREPKKYGQYKDGMDGGPDNPLGARAIYLYQGKKDTYIRIHGTNQPQTVGTSSSNGCFRMVNEHVMDLYTRVGMGSEVIVM